MSSPGMPCRRVGDAIPPIQGIGGIMVQPTGFVIVRVQIPCVAGYDEDQVTIVLDDPGMKEYPIILVRLLSIR